MPIAPFQHLRRLAVLRVVAVGIVVITAAGGCAAVAKAQPRTVTLPAFEVDTALLGAEAPDAPVSILSPVSPAAPVTAMPDISAAPLGFASSPIATVPAVVPAAAPTTTRTDALPGMPKAAAPITPSVAAPKTAAKVIAPQAATAAPVPPSLDVASLKTRLRDTKAIGIFSKLALKNQMDDVLEQFRSAYRDGHKTAPLTLRQPYDLLVMKVLALLQDGDPELARSVAGSREAIWMILASAEQFRTVA